MKLSDYITERLDRITPDIEDLAYRRVSKISFKGNISIANSKKSKTKMIVVQPNDFLVSGINASKGALSINDTGQTLCATIHYSSYEIDTTKVDFDFFSMLIKSDLFTAKLSEMVRGGIKTELKAKHILNMDIKLPVIDMQREIMQDYSRQKKAISNNYFHNYDPKRIRRIKEQLYDKVLFNGKHFDPSNPTAELATKCVPIAEILKDGPKNGYSPNPVNTPTKNRVLSLSATTSEVLVEENFKYFNELAKEAFVVQAGDIFVQRGNSRDFVGVTAYCETTPRETVTYPDLMMRLRTNDMVTPEYLVYYLNSGNIRRYFRHKAKGTVDTMVKINQSTLQSLYVPLPELKQQDEIVLKVRNIRRHLHDLESSINYVNQKTENVLMKYFEKKVLENID